MTVTTWFMSLVYALQMGQTLTSPHREVSSIPFSLVILWAAKAMLLELLLCFLFFYLPVQGWFLDQTAL